MILLVPIWLTQNWFPMIRDMLINIPRFFLVKDNTLSIPGTQKVHLLSNNLLLMACCLSGTPSNAEIFRKKQPKSSFLGQPTKKQFSTYINKWVQFCLKRKTDNR